LKPSNTHQRISDVFGKRINQELVPVETETTLCTIKGYVATPQNAKKKGCHQYFFVNGRYMKHPYFHKAVMSAYDRLIPEGEQVSYFLYLTVNPENIDVNIHPVKTEIKFDNEQAIWQIIMATVRDAIGRFTGVTSLDFDQEGKPNIPVFTPDENTMAKAPHIDFNPNYNPFKGATNQNFSSRPSAKGWEELFSSPQPSDIRHQTPDINHQASFSPQFSIFNSQFSILQQPYKGRYILCEGENGMIIIDQYRASQRVLFERYKQAFEDHNAHTQKVLFPEVIQFPASYSDQLPSILEELQHLGFEISNLGGGSYSINGVPAGLGGMDATKLVGELVNETIEQGVKASEEVHTILALGLAKRAATPVGEIMSPEDTENLIKQLLECSTQKYTPDGKLILTEIPDDELLKKFH
jgi:DNA mismatch repair protein MutL